MLQGMTKTFAMGVAAGALLATSVAAEDAPPELLLGELEADINALPMLTYNTARYGDLDDVIAALSKTGQTTLGETHLLSLAGDSLVTFINPYNENFDSATASLVAINADRETAFILAYSTISSDDFPEGVSSIEDPEAFSFSIASYASPVWACMSDEFRAQVSTDEARQAVTGEINHGSVPIGNGDLEVHFLQHPEMPFGVMELRTEDLTCTATGAMMREPVEPLPVPEEEADHIPVFGTLRPIEI